MKKLLAGLLIASALLLSACGSSSSNSSKSSNNEYDYIYQTDIATLDYTVSSRQTDNMHYTNFVDGLMETDQYGNIHGALAKSYEVSDDGLTYTYHLRKGVKWVDSEGNDYADVTAQDFVTGLKHAVAEKSETLYIVADSIKGLSDYIDGKTSDFSTVGVKAVDKNTVQYTLNKAEPYWNSKTMYGILYPVNAKFLKEKGSDFGKAKPENILYNGGYILTNNTAKSVIEYKKNDSYWDKKNIHFDTVKYTFNDLSDPDSIYNGFADGTYSQARVYPNAAGYKTVEKENGDNIVVTPNDSTTYNLVFNVNRQSYNVTAKTTDTEKAATKAAILNKNFRLAIQAALDKKAYNAQNVGDAVAEDSLRNTLTPENFVSVNGESYGSVVQSKLQALDSDNYGSINLADGQDATYDKAKAKTYIEAAKKELAAEGVTGTIHLDLPVLETSTTQVNSAKSLKKSIESSLGKDNVQVDIQLLGQDKFLAVTYQVTSGTNADYDISNASGWSADYQDPSSYLNIYNTKNGDSLQTLGLNGTETSDDTASSVEVENKLGMNTYDELLDKASAITDDVNARYDAYADAEAWLLDNVLQIPLRTYGGLPYVTRVKPFSGEYSQTGITDQWRLKYVELQDSTVTTKEYNAAKAKWEKKVKEANSDTANSSK